MTSVLRTADECLAKAMEMEERAAQAAAPNECAEFLDMARSWRGVARRAAVQDAIGGALPRQFAEPPSATERCVQR